MRASNKIVFNTVVVYSQQIITALISLISVRFVLQALGAEDYGVYMLVAGVVVLLNVLSNTMSNTSMRFMSYSLGKGDLDISKKTFNTTLYIHYCLALAIVVILEIGGWIMFEYFLNIPNEKIYAAKVVYQFMIVSTLVTVVSVPFDAIINSHENLLFLSIVTVLGSILGLCIALSLLNYEGNRLILYGFLVMVLNILLRIIKQVYTRQKYPECRVNFRDYRDHTLMKSILSFTGWDFLNSFAALCSTQIRGILINMFFGVRLNAAEGIGKKINTQLNTVSTGITRSITPQMNIRAGRGDINGMIQLMNIGVKYTTFMYCLVCVPVLLEINYILDVWLKDVPAYTAIFCQMCILIQMTDKFTWQISNAIRAVGQIKKIMIVNSSLAISSIIIGYIFFKLGAGPIYIYLVELVICFVIAGVRFYFGNKIVHIRPLQFIQDSTIPVIIPIVVALIFTMPLLFILNQGLTRLLCVLILFVGIDSVIFWIFFMNNNEKHKIKYLILKVLHRNNEKN